MRKIVILLFIMTIFLFAKSDVATKDDIRVLSNKIDKLSEQVDKRFEQMQHNIDNRFEETHYYMDREFAKKG